VEFAGEFNQFVHSDIKRWFPDLYQLVDIKIIEPSTELLGAFAKDLKKYTMSKFRADGIDLLTGTGVRQIAHLGEEGDLQNRTCAHLTNDQV